MNEQGEFMLGVIGGSGFYKTFGESVRHVETPHGWLRVAIAERNGEEIAFVPRHGETHALPPHKVNYKANMMALQKLGAEEVVGINAVGIISKFSSGDIILLEDFIGFHLGPITYYDSFAGGPRHTDMGEPFSKALNAKILKASAKAKIKIKTGGIVATAFGPRFETPAEIAAFGKLGANLISMTSAYEAILARELGLRYSSIAIGTNRAAGLSRKQLTHEEVVAMMEKKENDVRKIIDTLVKL